MPDTNEKSSFAFSNPVKGAVAGLGVSAVTAIGASIKGHDVHQEAMTNLVGGVIVGAIAGSLGCCVPNPENFELCGKFSIYLLQAAISTGVTFTAPLMGETVMGLGANYMQTVADSFIGSGVVSGAALGLAGVGLGATYCAYSLFGKTEEPQAESTNVQTPSTPVVADMV
jgi:hypothetical protein